MLNEGYDLYRSLERCGISLAHRHPDVQKPGKKDGLIVGLNARGSVARIEFRDGEGVAGLWTIGEGNQNRFPVIKLQHPLWDVSLDDSVRTDLDELKNAELKKRQFLIRQSNELNITSSESNWWKRLRERVSELRPFFQTTNKKYIALYELMGRFVEAGDISGFLQGLLKQVKDHHDEIPYPLLETILIGNKWDKKKQEFRAEVPLVMDLSDWENYSTRIAGQTIEPFVNECLFRMQSGSVESGSVTESIQEGRESALSGQIVPLENKKFPNPRLPIIGITYLFAVNDQTPCQTRYRKTSTDIFPAGRKEANAIQDSLCWITAEDRFEKTWYPVPGSRDGEYNLLIAYLADKPDLKINKARMLGGVSSSDLSELTFGETAAPLIYAYRGKSILKANDRIRFFILRQADPGRKQIVVDRNTTVADIVKAAQIWQEAGKNVPPFDLLFPGKKGEKAKVLVPPCPFPADFVRITQMQWVKQGKQCSKKVAGISLGNVYDIFFEQDGKDKRTVQVVLGVILKRTRSLLIGFGGAMHKNITKQYNVDARFSVLLSISLISTCLYKLGIRKEDYMRDTFFYIGRFLSLVDTLHMEYCKNVRDGSVPPQLLGNSHLHLALGNPAAAFALLSQRIGIYQAWTRKERDEKVKLARWAVGELGEIAHMLAEKGLPAVTDDIGKSQILLGYLAKSEKKEHEKPAAKSAE